MQSYNHFSENDRFLIDTLYNAEHKSIREIAKILQKNPSSVSREIKRNKVYGDYVYLIAQNKAKDRSWHCHSFYLHKYSDFAKLFKKYYDKRFCGVYETMHKLRLMYPNKNFPSERQIFRWLRSNRWEVKRVDRLRFQYNHPKKRVVGVFGDIKRHWVRPYWSRPKYISLRTQIGHWEGDLIVGIKARGHKNILTLNDIATRKLYAVFVKDKNPYAINKIIKKMILENNLPFHSLTLDNGLEFQAIGSLGKEMKFPIYICEPYASYQRGSNEHLNGMIRRFWKKGTDFNIFTDDDLQIIVSRINNMKRKIFNWKSSNDMWNEKKKGLPWGKPS